MKFWDTSALVPLLVSEAKTARLQAIAAKDPTMFVWWGSQVECVSALARLEREGVLDELTVSLADRLRQLAAPGKKSMQVMPFEKRPCDLFACIRYAPQTRCNWPPRISLPSGVLPHWNS